MFFYIQSVSAYGTPVQVCSSLTVTDHILHKKQENTVETRLSGPHTNSRLSRLRTLTYPNIKIKSYNLDLPIVQIEFMHQ